jgi:hypothetical protein
VRILAGLLLLLQGHAKKPWIWTEETPTYNPDAPNPRLPSHGFGARIAVLGDLDHDGVADLAISAPLETGGPESGCVFVVSGLDGHLLRTIANPHGADRFGVTLESCADVDLDGYEDLVVGSRGNFTCVVSSRTEGLIRKFSHRSAVAASDLDGDGVPEWISGCLLDCGERRHDHRGFVSAVSGCDEAELWRVYGSPETCLPGGGFRMDGFGGVLCVLGDLDGDGVPDLAAGIPGHLRAEQRVGGVRFLSGKTGATLFVVPGPFAPDQFGAGTRLRRIGDLDGDGNDDVLVASESDRPVFALSSRTGDVLLTLRHQLSYGNLAGFGDSIAIAGDLDRDGIADIAVGCSEFLDDEGDGYSVEVFSGSDGHLLVGLDAGDQHAIVGDSQDFDRDGIPDLPVGLPETDEVLILSGRELQAKLRGPPVLRSDWPLLKAIRRADLVR